MTCNCNHLGDGTCEYKWQRDQYRIDRDGWRDRAEKFERNSYLWSALFVTFSPFWFYGLVRTIIWLANFIQHIHYVP